jgi:hypothetical protein
MDKNLIIGLSTTFYLISLYILHKSYDIYYRIKYRDFTNETNKQYIKLLEKAKQQALIDALNIDRKDLNNKCPYCGKEIENEDSM